MMDISTTYMGIKIDSPLIIASSGITANVSNIEKCAENGAGAIVLKSLFEEQIVADKNLLVNQDDMYFWFPQAIEFVKQAGKENGIAQYLELIKKAKERVKIPVIASINCITANQWPEFAKEIEAAGADGLELNIFIPPNNIHLTGYKMEEAYLDIIRAVKEQVSIPIGVKTGFYFTNPYRHIFKMSNHDIDNIVLFNRYYRPDIDIDQMKLTPFSVFSNENEITLSLRWIALLSDKVNCSLVAASGIHDYRGVVKQIMAGASAVQICSVLYLKGLGYLTELIQGLKNWMEGKGYANLSAFRGIITRAEENSAAFERVQFMRKTTGEI